MDHIKSRPKESWTIAEIFILGLRDPDFFDGDCFQRKLRDEVKKLYLDAVEKAQLAVKCSKDVENKMMEFEVANRFDSVTMKKIPLLAHRIEKLE